MPPGDAGTLDARLRALEDRAAILDLLAGLAHSADIASESYWRDAFGDDAILDAGRGGAPDRGHAAILGIIGGAGQRTATQAGMAHLAALPHVSLDGDRATATGYLLVVVPDAHAPVVVLPGKGPSLPLSIYHLTVNRWELMRTPAGWKIVRRVIRPVGTDEARRILAEGIGKRGG